MDSGIAPFTNRLPLTNPMKLFRRTITVRLILATFCLSGFIEAAPGDLDTSFNGTGMVTTAIGGTQFGGGSDYANGVAVQTDGKIVVAGSTNDNGAHLIALVRHQTNGSLDPTFGTSGFVKSDISFGANQSEGNAVALQADGKIIVAGKSAGSFAVARYTTSGVLDATFGTGGVVTTTDFGLLTSGDNGAFALALQSDGKIVAAGQYHDGNNHHWFAVARYNTDGSPDTTFNGTGNTIAINGSGDSYARAVAIQSDGKIVVAGHGSDGVSGHTQDAIVMRFTSNGVLDTSFGGGKVVTDLGGVESLHGVIVHSSGRIITVGDTTANGGMDACLLSFNSNGTRDSTFNSTGRVITALSATGSDSGYAVREVSSGRLMIAGFAIVGSAFDFALARYTIAGALDVTFGSGGKVTTPIGIDEDLAWAMDVQSDGRIVLAGATQGVTADFAVARYRSGDQLGITLAATNVTGSGATLNGSVTAGIVAVSVSFDFGPTTSYGSSVGAVPSTVNAGVTAAVSSAFFGLAGTYHYRVKVQSVLGTTFGQDMTFTLPESNAWLANITPSVGSLTPAFVSQQLSYALNIPGSVPSIAFRPTKAGQTATIRLNGGPIVTSGQYTTPMPLLGGLTTVSFEVTAQDGVTRKTYTIAVFRGETGPGGLDGLFGTAGIRMDSYLFDTEASAIAIAGDGKMVTVGAKSISGAAGILISRFNADGTPDLSFSGSGFASVGFSGADIGHGVAVQSDGKIIAVGEAEVGGFKQFAIIRYLPGGDPDLDFGGTGYVLTNIGTGDDRAMSVALQADGKIVVGGTSADQDFIEQMFTVARYNTDGSLDTTFNGTGIVTTAFDVIDSLGDASSVLVQTNGKIVVAGTLYASDTRFALMRLNANGSLDTTFNSTGKVTTPVGNAGYAIGRQAALQADGKVLVTGYVFNGSGYDFGLVRYNANGSLDPTFNSTGKVITDFAGRSDYAESVAVDAMGMIVVGGWSKNTTDFSSDFTIARYNADGSPDPSFVQLGQPLAAGQVLTAISPTFDDVANAVAVLPDGKIIAAGYTSDATGTHHLALVRYHGYDNRGSWRLRYFGNTSNTGNAAFDIDADHDSLPNLLEYAFGLDPSRSSASELPKWINNEVEYYLDSTEPFGIYGITYGAEWSATMSPLDWHPVTDTGINGRHFFVVPVNGNEKLFFRIKVTGL